MPSWNDSSCMCVQCTLYSSLPELKNFTWMAMNYYIVSCPTRLSSQEQRNVAQRCANYYLIGIYELGNQHLPASSPCVTSPRWLFVIAHPFVNFKLVKDNRPYVARRLEDLSSGLYKSTSWSTHQPIPDIYNPSHHKSAARFEKWELNCQIECNLCDRGKKTETETKTKT